MINAIYTCSKCNTVSFNGTASDRCPKQDCDGLFKYKYVGGEENA